MFRDRRLVLCNAVEAITPFSSKSPMSDNLSSTIRLINILDFLLGELDETEGLEKVALFVDTVESKLESDQWDDEDLVRLYDRAWNSSTYPMRVILKRLMGLGVLNEFSH